MPLASAIVFHLLEALDRPCQVVSLSEETMDHLTNDWYLNLELSQFKSVQPAGSEYQAKHTTSEVDGIREKGSLRHATRPTTNP